MLRFTTAGESHGPALVSILEGMPAGLSLLAEHVNEELARRQQGYGRGRRMQIERDAVELLSGVRAGETIGSPIAMVARIDAAKRAGNTLGGICEVVATGVPVGLGSHVSWDTKLDGRIGAAMLS